MSTALIQSFEHLLIAANERLTADIKAETNPARIDHLLTLAYRAGIPRGLHAPSPTRHPHTHQPPIDADTLGRPSFSPSPNPQSPASAPTLPSSPRDSSLIAHTSSSAPALTSALPSEAAPLLAAAGAGVRRFGERLADAPSDQPTPAPQATPSTPSPSPSPSPNPQSEIPNPQSGPAVPSPSPCTRDSSLVAHTSSRSLTIEELARPAIAELIAQRAALPPEVREAPGPYVFATAYLIKNNYITHPKAADGTLLPLATRDHPDIQALENAVITLEAANFRYRLEREHLARRARAAAQAQSTKPPTRKRAPPTTTREAG